MENIKEVFEDLVDEVVDAAEDVTSCFSLYAWPITVEAARRRLQKSRQALSEFFAEQVEKR